MRITVYFILILLTSNSCVAQKKEKFEYRTVNSKLVDNSALMSFSGNEKIQTSFGLLEGSLEDYTQVLQRAINSNDTVVLPNRSMNISYPGLRLKSNSTLAFQSESALVMAPNDKTHYEMLNLDGVENVVILNPKLIGDREQHTGTGGEWGMGINILSSKNIKIVNPRISKCWGDGIYIGRNKTTNNASSNIEILGGLIDYNRRNGISIISVDSLKIENTTISNTYGTMPMSGIDIEPNRDDEILKNIVLNNVRTFNNFSEGIKLVFAYALNPHQKIDIKIQNHHDIGSTRALTLVGVRPEDINKRSFVSGTVDITDPKWEGNSQLIKFQHDMTIPIDVSITDGRVIRNGISKKLRKRMLEETNRSLINID